MAHLCSKWPNIHITPKLHILEDHVVPFVKFWKVGCGFYGEQGAENLHHEFNLMKKNYSGIRNNIERLRYLMNAHLLSVCPRVQNICAHKKRKNSGIANLQSYIYCVRYCSSKLFFRKLNLTSEEIFLNIQKYLEYTKKFQATFFFIGFIGLSPFKITLGWHCKNLCRLSISI